MAEHAELLEDSFVSYLTGIDPSPWDEILFDDDENPRIYPGENNLEKDGARIVCYVADLTEEPLFSGNRWAEVMIDLRTPISTDANTTAEAMLEAHKANAAALQDAINDSTLIASLNLTAGIYVYSITEKNPFRSQDETGWQSGWKLRVFSAPN